MPYKNPEDAKKRSRRYYQEHKEECLKRSRDYRKRNRKKFNAYAREWLRRKKQDVNWLAKYTEKRRKYNRKRRHGLRRQIIKLLGGKCIRCGFSDKRALQIDHVHGGGRRHAGRKYGKKFTKHGTHQAGGISNYVVYLNKILNEIKAGSKDYQLLCANCNWIKKFEENEK